MVVGPGSDELLTSSAAFWICIPAVEAIYIENFGFDFRGKYQNKQGGKEEPNIKRAVCFHLL